MAVFLSKLILHPCVAVFDAYMKLAGFEMEESIKRETSGGLRDLLLAVGTKTTAGWVSVVPL